MAWCPKLLMNVAGSMPELAARAFRASLSLASVSFARAAGMMLKAMSCFVMPSRSATSPAQIEWGVPICYMCLRSIQCPDHVDIRKRHSADFEAPLLQSWRKCAQLVGIKSRDYTE